MPLSASSELTTCTSAMRRVRSVSGPVGTAEVLGTGTVVATGVLEVGAPAVVSVLPPPPQADATPVIDRNTATTARRRRTGAPYSLGRRPRHPRDAEAITADPPLVEEPLTLVTLDGAARRWSCG